MIKVSVIVPVFNTEQYLGDALYSLTRQSLGDELEVVVVNDGSTDASQNVIDSYAAAYPGRIVSVVSNNRGAAHARNLGLEKARGEYVGFVDSDDTVDLTMFEKLYEKATQEGADIATCGYLRIDGDDIQRRDYVQRKCFGFNLMQAPMLLRRNVPYVWNKLFRKSLLVQNGISFDESLSIYEDMIFTYKSFFFANKVVKVSETLYHYNFSRLGSLTFHFSDKRFQLFDAFGKIVDFYSSQGVFCHVQDELLYVFLTHVFSAFENDCDSFKQRKDIGRFFKDAIAFLDERFPWWRHCDSFFKARHKPSVLYSKTWFLNLLLLRPPWIMRAHKNLRLLGRELRRSHVGMTYARTLNRHRVDDAIVLVDSQRGTNLSGNMFYVVLAMLEDPSFFDRKIFITYKTEKALESFRGLLFFYNVNLDRLEFVKYNSPKYAKLLARARMVVTDTSMPVYFVKREGQVYVNTWHGTPLKRLGRDMEEDYHTLANLTKNFAVSDYLAFQSEYMAECMDRAYMYSGISSGTTIVTGYPRNDIFFNLDRRDEVRRLVDIRDMEVIGYLPTWRGTLDSVVDRSESLEDILLSIDMKLRDDQVLFVNLHPYDAEAVDLSGCRHIRMFPSEYETYDFLNACDILITDYSSVMFDFAVTQRKVVLFAYDKDEYLTDRGLYLKFNQLPFPCVEDVDSLIHELSRPVNMEMARKAVLKFCPIDSGESASFVCSLLAGDVAVSDGAEYRYKQNKAISARTLLLVSNFDDARLVEEWVALSRAFGRSSKQLYVHYDNQLVRNKETLKLLDDDTHWAGVSFPFTFSTIGERVALSSLKLHFGGKGFSGRFIRRAMRNEWRRAYGACKFDEVIVYAGESYSNVVWASFAEGDKAFLVTAETLDRFMLLPKRLIDRFDTCYCIGTEVYDAVSNMNSNMRFVRLSRFSEIVGI